MQGTEQDITDSVKKDIEVFNNTYLKNSGKKLTNVFKTKEGLLFKISLPGPAYDKDNSKDYEKNKKNIRQGEYANIYIKSSERNEQQAFADLNQSFERERISFGYIQANNKEKTQIYFTSPKIITDNQNNLQEILRSAIADNNTDINGVKNHIKKFNDYLLKNKYGNFIFIFNKNDQKKYNDIKNEYKQKTQENQDKGTSNEENEKNTKCLLKETMSFRCYIKKEKEIILPIEAKEHELNLGSKQLLEDLKKKLLDKQNSPGRKPLDKIKSESIKDIIFEDEFRKFCIDNDIDGNKKISELNDQQIKEFKQRLDEAEHNYPCNIEKEIKNEQLLKDFFQDFEKKLSEKIKEFLVNEKDLVADNVRKEIEETLEEKERNQSLLNERVLNTLCVNDLLSEEKKKVIYKNILLLKKEAYQELVETEKYKDIKLDFGFDKQVFETTVLRYNKNSEKKIKKLFLSTSMLDKATTPLHDNIQIISAYQCALGNNQMKIYGGDIMEDCHSRGYITGEDLEEKYYDLYKQITIDIESDPRAHNRLRTNIYDSKQQGKRFATPISAKARIKYILTNIIDDNHVGNYFYKIGNDENGKQIITEIIQFDYDKNNQIENRDNIALKFKTFETSEENYILPWNHNPYLQEDNSVNVKEELDIFLKEVNKIITIDPKTMFNIIAYRLSLTNVKVAEKLDVIHDLMQQHVTLLGHLQGQINNSLVSLEKSQYHKNDIYREYGEKLKYIAESVLPERINSWNDFLKKKNILNMRDKKKEKAEAINIMKQYFNTDQVIPQIQKDIEEYNKKKKEKEEEERKKKEEEEMKKIEEEERKKKEEEMKKNSGQFHNTKNSILINNLIGNTNENNKNLMNIPEKLIDPTKISQNNYTNNKTYKKTNNTNNKTEHTTKKQYNDITKGQYKQSIIDNNNNEKKISLEENDDGKQQGCCGGCSFFKSK